MKLPACESDSSHSSVGKNKKTIKKILLVLELLPNVPTFARQPHTMGVVLVRGELQVASQLFNFKST